mmetsp:Transcript_29221/g.86518  ORF Transcript_29221/g.86518 Transcript_29221/m.86518 type:complete len:296 (-) Transcript_29221:1483-2370(-)
MPPSPRRGTPRRRPTRTGPRHPPFPRTTSRTQTGTGSDRTPSARRRVLPGGRQNGGGPGTARPAYRRAAMFRPRALLLLPILRRRTWPPGGEHGRAARTPRRPCVAARPPMSPSRRRCSRAPKTTAGGRGEASGAAPKRRARVPGRGQEYAPSRGGGRPPPPAPPPFRSRVPPPPRDGRGGRPSAATRRRAPSSRFRLCRCCCRRRRRRTGASRPPPSRPPSREDSPPVRGLDPCCICRPPRELPRSTRRRTACPGGRRHGARPRCRRPRPRRLRFPLRRPRLLLRAIGVGPGPC